MKVEFLAAAREEFLNAVSYCDSKKQGLGDEFYNEVWRTISRVVSHPFCVAANLNKNETLSYQEVSLRSYISGDVGFNTDNRRDASAPTPRELAA